MREYFYTHEHEAIWPAGSCTVTNRIQNGDTSFATFDDATEILRIYTPDPKDVGVNSLTMEAFYSAFEEPTPPTETATQTIQVEITPLCVIDSYVND